jgi:hydroxymethylbilane synthase
LIRVGTRGSALARAQAQWVADRLETHTELIAITTAGDRGAPATDKSRWVSELERALLEDEIDVAVHSAKDVPAELAEGLELVAIPARLEARDALCGARSLHELGAGARIGTSSLRRAAQIRAVRDDLEVVAVRGNVDTRLRKLAEHEYDALVLAAAGLERLGRASEAGGLLDELVPAAGQGALALEGHANALDPAVLAPLIDPEAIAEVTAERQLTRALGASCNTAVGAHAQATDGGAQVELRAWVGRADGSIWLTDRLRGDPSAIGTTVAQRMLAAGAAELLR